VKSIDYDDPNKAASTNSTPAEQPHNRAEAPPQPVREHPEKSAIQTKTFVIPAGTEVSVQNDETIDSSNAAEGQTYAAEVTSDVHDANGAVVIPKGANAQLVIKSASSGGRIRGAADLVIDLKSISVAGQQYAVDTTDLRKEGNEGVGINKRT